MDGLKITLGSVKGMPRRMSDGIIFLLVLRGSVELEHNGSLYALGNNDIVVLEQGDLFALSGKKNNVLLFINISGEYILKHLPNFLKGAIRCNSCNPDEHNDSIYTALKKNVVRMAFIYYKKEKGYELLFQSVLFEALHILAKDFSSEISQAQDKNPEHERLHTSLMYIHQNFRARISLEDVAKREFMSVQYLSRLFREQLNTTFMGYLNSLRISAVERELIFTSDTITRIALNNGFASARSLNGQFIKKHGCSPAEYRKAYKPAETINPVNNIHLVDEHENNSLETLVKFINAANLDVAENVQANYLIDLEPASVSPLPAFQNIVEIGDLRLALRADMRKQLEEANRQLHLSGVSFGGLFRMIYEVGSARGLFQTYDLYEALSFLHRLGLMPLIRLETEEFKIFASAGEGLKILSDFLHSLQLRYSSAVFKQWRFEITGSIDDAGLYADIYGIIKSVNTNVQVGLRLDPFLSPKNTDQLKQLTANAAPDFFGFTFDPNEESRPADQSDFNALFREYHIKAVNSVMACIESAGCPSRPLYLMSWNVLTGSTPVEAGEFHRTALMVDVLCSLRGTVAGAAVLLNLYVDQSSNFNLLTRPLSLYLTKDIHRPMFFISKAIASLKPHIVWSSENGLLTADGEDRYALLLYNACYIDPFRALDNIRLQGNMLNCSITLQGLAPGRYRIKELLMDKDKGSLYHNSMKLDLSIPLDEDDWDEYIESISRPSVTLWDIHTEDCSLQIRTELDINAVVLFIIKRFA